MAYNKNAKTRQVQQTTVEKAVVNPKIAGDFNQRSFWANYWLESLIIMVLSLGLYYQSFQYGYVLDDLIVIEENNFTKKGIAGIKDIMTTESMTGYFGENKNLVQGNRYRPLSLVTFAIEYEISGGLNPKLGHWINVILYGLTGILILMFLSLLFRNYPRESRLLAIPFLATLIFIVHPIHTEAVANIKGRDEIMAMMFSIASAYAALRYMDKQSKWWLFGSAFYLFLGLLSKENAITFLVVIPLSIYFFSQINWGTLLRLCGVLVLTVVLYLILRFSTSGVPEFGKVSTDIMNNPFLGMRGLEKIGTIFYTLGKYIQLMIFPHPLTHDYYPYAIPKVNLFHPYSMVAFLGHLALLWYALKNMAKKTVVSYSILYYLVTLSIVSNIVINLGTFMNDRFIFMASLGYCILLAYFISEVITKLNIKHIRTIAVGIRFLIIVAYILKTYDRVPDWKDALTLNQSAIKVSSNSARANSFMATALFNTFQDQKTLEGKLQHLKDALPYARKAVEILPEYYNGNLMEAGIVAEIFKLDGDVPRYLREIRPVMMRRPDIPFLKEFSDYMNSKGYYQKELYEFYMSVGEELMKNRKYSRLSIQYLQMAVDLSPNSARANELISKAYEMHGDQNNAQKHLLRAKAGQ